jgi:proteasome lid subunit RPN8/RPN11
MRGAASLRGEQIQRYSRAILLGPVGGRGQHALLSTGVRLGAGGPALLTAAAYLAAGGTPVSGPPGRLGPEDVGFLCEASELGQPASLVVGRALGALNPDAVEEPSRWGALVALPDAPTGERPLVAVGSRGGCSLVWAAGAGACSACLADAVAGCGAPPTGPAAVQVGALAAVLFERLLLGLGPQLSGLEVDAEGATVARAAPPCAHAPALPAQLLAEAVRHLETCYPEEGCGVVLEGPAGARWVALPNAYARWAKADPDAFPRDARTAFVFEPAEWLAVLREADRRGERVACIVHAHPDGPAAFSAEDAAQAAPGGIPLVPGAGYLVVSVRRGRAAAAAWVRWQDGFRETPFFLPG